MMHEAVIFYPQLMHHRKLTKRTTELHDRWNDMLSWYPKEQRRQYKQFDKIYSESLQKYGEKKFKKYAESRRLIASHTKVIDKPKLLQHKKMSCYPMNYMADYQPSVTTNGEYGHIIPGYHYKC